MSIEPGARGGLPVPRWAAAGLVGARSRSGAALLLAVAMLELAAAQGNGTAWGADQHVSGGAAEARARARPVILLGIDGLDFRLVKEGMAAGRLPAMAGLAAEGSFGPLVPTTPAESPVSWASLVTGLNPGGTGIFDFVRRVRGTYDVELATVRRSRVATGVPRPWVPAALGAALCALAWLAGRRGAGRRGWRVLGWAGGGAMLAVSLAAGRLPEMRDHAEPARQGVALWDALGDSGVATTVLWAPLEFPPRTTSASVRLLPGLGVPDLMGTQGTYSLLTDRADGPGGDLEMGGRVIPLKWADGRASVALAGPFETQCRLELARETGGAVALSLPDGPARLEPGGWTGLRRLEYPLLPGLALSCLSRLYLARRPDSSVTLYVSPGALDPAAPPPGLRLSHPSSFAPELAARHGPFTTLGWAADTMAVQDGTLAEDAFMVSLQDNYWAREQILLDQVRRTDWKVLVAVLEEPDRVSHVLWRARDARHPFHDAALAARHGGAIDSVYGWVDRTVAELRKARPDATLLLVSDHGFAPFYQAVNLNRWLHDNGYLVFEGGPARATDRVLSDLFKGRNLWSGVDWSRTKAYSVGLGLIYFNLLGREPAGSVRPGAEAAHLSAQLRTGLAAVTLPGSGERVIRSVEEGGGLYRGSHLSDAPDLVVSFEPGFRVSWQSALGGLDEPVLAPNRRPWSADHCSVAAGEVPGVVMSDLRLRVGGAGVLDVAPTVLELAGLQVPARLEGRSLVVRP